MARWSLLAGSRCDGTAALAPGSYAGAGGVRRCASGAVGIGGPAVIGPAGVGGACGSHRAPGAARAAAYQASPGRQPHTHIVGMRYARDLDHKTYTIVFALKSRSRGYNVVLCKCEKNGPFRLFSVFFFICSGHTSFARSRAFVEDAPLLPPGALRCPEDRTRRKGVSGAGYMKYMIVGGG